MPSSQSAIPFSSAERRQEVAGTLAEGVIRYQRIAQFNEITDAQGCVNADQNSLDFLGKTRLSVSHGTRDLGMRNEGDDA